MNEKEAIGKARELLKENMPIKQIEQDLGKLVFLTLSGAHMWGFPSVDSDYDIRGIYIAPTSKVLSLYPKPKQTFRFESEDKILDLNLVEIEHYLDHIDVRDKKTGERRGNTNGNYLEWLNSSHIFYIGENLERLREVALGAVNKGLFNHYNHFTLGKQKEARETKEAKDFLYVLRTKLTGIHLMRNGVVEPNISFLNENYFHIPEIDELIRIKNSGEHATIPEDLQTRIHSVNKDLSEELLRAKEASTLPEYVPNSEEINRFLLDTRKKYLG